MSFAMLYKMFLIYRESRFVRCYAELRVFSGLNGFDFNRVGSVTNACDNTNVI